MLTTEDIGKYDVRYRGKHNVDEIPCYQFAVKPKTMARGKRYFEGEIWVDDRDLQIVKTYGKGVGAAEEERGQPVPEIRNVSRADRWKILVPDLHPGERHAAFQRFDRSTSGWS